MASETKLSSSIIIHLISTFDSCNKHTHTHAVGERVRTMYEYHHKIESENVNEPENHQIEQK